MTWEIWMVHRKLEDLRRHTASSPSPRWKDQTTTWSIFLPCTIPGLNNSVGRWSEEVSDALQDCFETTDWEALCEPHGEDIEGLTDFITDFIEFCVDITWRWLNASQQQALLHQRARDPPKQEEGGVQVRWQGSSQKGTESGRTATGGQLQEEAGTQAPEEQHQVWRDITGYNTSSQVTGGDMHRANQLNLFFNRFETVPLYPVHLRPCPQYRVLPPVEIIWWVYSGWMHQGWWGGRVQGCGGQFRRLVLAQPPAAQHQ